MCAPPYVARVPTTSGISGKPDKIRDGFPVLEMSQMFCHFIEFLRICRFLEKLNVPALFTSNLGYSGASLLSKYFMAL